MQFLNLGLLGKNISYSISPRIHERIFQITDIKGRYDLIDTEKIEIEKITENYNGINITIPYKESILEFIDEFHSSVKKTGAVNTVSIKKKISGYNTDYSSFLQLLKMKNIYPRNALVLGAGGASRAAIAALMDIGCKKISVINRSDERLRRLKENFPVDVELIHKYDMVVNTIPLSGNDFIASKIKDVDFSFYADFVYNGETELTKIAKRKNISGIDGIEILLLQAIHSQEIWQGRELKDIYDRMVKEFAGKQFW